MLFNRAKFIWGSEICSLIAHRIDHIGACQVQLPMTSQVYESFKIPKLDHPLPDASPSKSKCSKIKTDLQDLSNKISLRDASISLEFRRTQTN